MNDGLEMEFLNFGEDPSLDEIVDEQELEEGDVKPNSVDLEEVEETDDAITTELEEDENEDEEEFDDEKEDQDTPDPVTEEDEEIDEDVSQEELDAYEAQIAEMIKEGFLLLDEDYEFEPTKEGVRKAILDSERNRDNLAVNQAIDWLLSEEGMDFARIRELKSNIQNLKSVDELDTDSKLDLVADDLRSQGLTDDEINKLTEDLVYDNKSLDMQATLALRRTQAKYQKELERTVVDPVIKKQENEQRLQAQRATIKETLSSSNDFNGYVLEDTKKDRIYQSLYQPIKNQKGDNSTEFRERLNIALSHPETLVVLADVLLNLDENGFNFPTIQKVSEAKATRNIRKSIRDINYGSSKPKMTSRKTQTKQDFDLSKAKFLF